MVYDQGAPGRYVAPRRAVGAVNAYAENRQIAGEQAATLIARQQLGSRVFACLFRLLLDRRRVTVDRAFLAFHLKRFVAEANSRAGAK
jgi:hypothetical protein